MSGGSGRARWLSGHRSVLGIGGAVVCFGLAVVWLFVVPDEADSATGWREVVLTYGHSIVWLLLGVAAGSYALGASPRIAAWSSYAALACYVAFIAALLL